MCESSYKRIGTTHIIESRPSNLEVVHLKKSLSKVKRNGINGSWFITGKPETSFARAYSNGKLISDGVSHRPPRGTLIYTKDGRMYIERLQTIKSNKDYQKGNIDWAISGGSLFPYYSPSSEGFTSSQTYTTHHTGIGWKKVNGIYVAVMFVRPSCPLSRLVQTSKNLGLEGSIFLDGGGSSQMYYDGVMMIVLFPIAAAAWPIDVQLVMMRSRSFIIERVSS